MIVELTINDKELLEQTISLDNTLFKTEAYNERTFCEMLNNKKYKIFVYIDKIVVGYIIIYDNIDYYEIFKIGVTYDKQNLGIGTQLIKFVQSLDYVNKLYLEVNSKNVNAIEFYKKNYFIQDGLRKNYYRQGEDGVLMEWSSVL